jgi:putative DNA methylase
MIPKGCKRLAEVEFPIAEVSKHAAREKSIRHGHPSTLHLWWARRPLASSRAVLLALLWPDPCDLPCRDCYWADVVTNCNILGVVQEPMQVWDAEAPYGEKR